MNKTGGHAFPSHGSMGEVVQEGMTLRDYFAAKALPCCLNGKDCPSVDDSDNPTDIEYMSRAAYAVADAMIAEREK